MVPASEIADTCTRMLPRTTAPNSIGCYIWRDRVCHVYIGQGSLPQELAVTGHEVKHCFDGNWHGTQECCG